MDERRLQGVPLDAILHEGVYIHCREPTRQDFKIGQCEWPGVYGLV